MAAEHRVNARDELARIERLRQIVVGAHLESDDAVDVLAFGRQHDDRHRLAGAAQPAAYRQAVFAGEHEVQHDEMRRIALQLLVEIARVGKGRDVEALLGQIARQRSRKRTSSSTTRILRRCVAMRSWRIKRLPARRCAARGVTNCNAGRLAQCPVAIETVDMRGTQMATIRSNVMQAPNRRIYERINHVRQVHSRKSSRVCSASQRRRRRRLLLGFCRRRAGATGRRSRRSASRE